MVQEPGPIELSSIPELREAVQAVLRTRRSVSIQSDGQEVARIIPSRRERSRPVRPQPLTARDPLWELIGMADSDTAADVSENHDRYLSESKLARGA